MNLLQEAVDTGKAPPPIPFFGSHALQPFPRHPNIQFVSQRFPGPFPPPSYAASRLSEFPAFPAQNIWIHAALRTHTELPQSSISVGEIASSSDEAQDSPRSAASILARRFKDFKSQKDQVEEDEYEQRSLNFVGQSLSLTSLQMTLQTRAMGARLLGITSH